LRASKVHPIEPIDHEHRPEDPFGWMVDGRD